MRPHILDGRTQVLGIFGYPLSYTLSPVFQNAGLREIGFNAVYLPFPAPGESFPALLRGLQKAGNFLGGNVTIPHKQAALKLVDRITGEAEGIGAVNTLYREGGRWIGHNTDASGFLRALGSGSKRGLKRARVLVLGAGGSARAVTFACARAGAERVEVASRRPEQAVDICRYLDRKIARPLLLEDGLLKTGLDQFDWIINTVPNKAFSKKVGRFLLGTKRPHSVFDITYDPLISPLLEAARKKGYEHINGLPMLLEQGAQSFSLWTHQGAPLPVMRKALENIVKRNPVK